MTEGDYMKIFEAKKDWRYAILSILSVLLFLSLYSFTNYNRYVGILLVVFTLVHFYQWKSTSYKVKNKELHIQSGIIRRKIPIKDITRIELIHNFDIFTSLSYEKLMITAIKDSQTITWAIAPIQFYKFVELLSSLNPNIQISEQVKEYCLLEHYEAETRTK